MGVYPGVKSPLRFLSIHWLLLCSGLAVAPLIPIPSPAELVINEFLPDPAGSDGGREFVELFNVGPVAVGLDEVVLQFAVRETRIN